MQLPVAVIVVTWSQQAVFLSRESSPIAWKLSAE
jgi:hypothetical protein